ncbi:DUF4382 domain-containing protein [uncultured Eudoraea sp.]|uniref:DUF4382 domain-containing protein n=1 Tax=uncultured Eudoraea sp. TaxID=1035614 RepID=UPI002619A47D|nr:DUF4382 domain-containing protein [uncultured Eudoraea sp.]
MKTYYYVLLALFSSILLFIGCSDYGNELQYVKYGKISVKLTDAPFPYDFIDEANVTIYKIETRIKNLDESKGDQDDSNFEVLYEGEQKVNLLTLTNGVTMAMGEAEVPVGSYDLVRVYIKEGSVVLKDGTTFDLKVPSGEQTGIKVFVKPAIEVFSSLSSDLLLDIDVSKSFIAIGNIESMSGITGFNFKPVIRASNMSIAGSLAGRVTTLVEDVETGLYGVQISVWDGEEHITSTSTDESGNYMVLGLDEGTYTILAEAMEYNTNIKEDVAILAANKTTLDFEMTAK